MDNYKKLGIECYMCGKWWHRGQPKFLTESFDPRPKLPGIVYTSAVLTIRYVCTDCAQQRP